MAYNPFRDGKQTQSTQTGRVNPFRQTSADRSDRERVMRNWQSDAEQHGILNNPQYTDEGKAYQQMAQEYAKYGTQYQNQLKQGVTGRQWAADTARRLEELTQQQRAAQQTERRRQDADAIGDPGLWVTTTEQYDALPEARRQEEARKAKQRPAVSLADYDKRIAELRKEKEWADYFAEAGLRDEAGYKAGSARGKATYESADAATARKRIGELEQRLVALNQNSGWASTVEQSDEIERERNAIQQELESLGAGYRNAQLADYTMSWRNGVRDNWTDEERSNFYYLYNDNKDEAQAYARRINDRYAYSDAQAEKEKVGEWASQNFWTGLAGTAASVGLTMTSLADTLDRTKEYAATGDVSAKSGLTPADIGMAMTSAIASSLNEKSGTINDNVWVIGGKGLGDLYETGVSILNSLASVYMLGGVGTYANFFGQASKTAYEEGIQRGLSVDKALTYGYASGVAEVAGEMFSIEHLIKMKNPSSLKGIIKNIFVQGGIEASEESATTLMNTISDAIINGDKSELASNYYALIQAGYSSEEASQLAISDWTQGIMYDALGGFVSGTVSGTIQSGVQGSMTYRGDAQELIDYAKSEGADTAAGKRAQKYEKRVQSGKRMTNYQAGTLTELAQEAVVSKDLDNIREAVGKRLSALGENNSALTEAVVRQAVQQEAEAADVSVPKVTEKQRGLIQNSKAAKRVLSEMDIGNMRMGTAAELSGYDSSQYQRSNEWARDIGTRIIAPGEYGVRSTNTVTAEEKRADVKVGDESGKVVGFKDGMARVEVTENGKSTIREVKPDDVQQLPKQTRRLFDEISRYDGDTQAAMYAAYMPGQDIEAYVQAADTAMNLYGAQTKATLEQARSFGKATFRMLSDAQLDALMQAGRKLADQRKAAAERTGESKGEVKQGKVSYDGGEADGRKLKAPSKEAIDRMSDAEKTLAEALTATGVNVVFYESEANAEGRYSGAQGMYHNGTVYLDVNAGMNSVESGQRTIVLTAAHEMTHFIRENSEAGYIALREFITDRLMQQGLDIEELVTQKRARESRELSYDEAVEEVIADACETVLTEPTAIRQLASDNMPLAKKIRKWLSDFFRKIKSAFAGLEAVHDEAKAMTDYMDELRAMWDSALADAVRNRANKNAAENGDRTKLSVREVGGQQIAWIENSGLSNKDLHDHKKIAEYIGRHIGEVYTIVESGQRVYIGEDLPAEYTQSEYTKRLLQNSPATLKAKNRAPGAFGDMIEIASGRRWEKTKHTHNKDAKYGMYRYNSRFAFAVNGGDGARNVRAYDVELLIRNASDGKKYLYDIVNIKKNTAYAVELQQRESRSGGKNAAPRNGVSDNSIRSSSENSNTKIKKSERDGEAARSADAVGIQYDSETESANPIKYSLRTWNESSYVQDREKAAAELSAVLKISKAKALKYIGDINAIAKLIADDRGRLDYEASPGRSSFVGNSEYGGSIDFSTICKKRRLLTGTLEAIQQALPNTALTAEEILSIRKMMADKGYEVSCGLCYVEGSRANMGKYTKEFLEEYAATNPEYLPNMAEMNTATGQETIRREHPEVYAAYEKYMNKLAQRKPKLYQLATEYQGEIRNKFKGKGSVEGKNLNGGMRLQSFSDFEIIHLIDCMQVIMDMAEVGLAGQAYTKVPDFAWALGGTGLKINLSLIAKGVDANGNLVLDETEGMHRADAEKLRNTYSQNVGTILVVFNDEQLTAAMQDDFIDFIIPFHRSQWNSTQYNLLGLPAGAKDYTPWQNESYIEPVYNKNGKKQRPANYMPNEYWDFSKSGKENAETYLKMCAANNRKPKFSMLLDKNADGSYSLKEDGSTDGYWKLLIDFKMYDNDGVGMPQQPVKPIFNMDESERMLREYTGGHNAFPAANDVVSEFVSEYKAKNGDARYSMRDDAMTDRELLARALDSVAATESERKLLAQYRTEFDRYQELYDKLDDAQIEYSAARRAVDDAYAQAKRSKLTAEERRRTESAWRERIGALKATQQETREARDKLLKEVDAQDRKLLKLRAMNPVKDMLSRARADMRETIKARQSKTDTRAKVRDMAKKLSDLLLKESKDKHVLLELQKPVAEVLDMLNLDTVNAAERVAKYDAAIAKTTDPEMKRELAETRDRIQAQGDRLKTRLDALHTAYQAIANSTDPTVANGYDENIAAKMQEVSQLVGDTPLAKMTQEQLDAVHDLLKMTYTAVSKANKAFVLNQKAGIEESAQAEIDRLSATEGADLGLKPVQFAKRQFWSMLKPGEIFHKVGGELERAYNEVRKGEDVRARDVVTARSFFQQAAEKHGYFSWALEEKHDFVSAQGRPFSLSLDDMMSVYATSRREQGKKHLEAGGIVFGKNGKIKVKKKGVTLTMSQIKARAYTLDEQVLDEIIGKLTPEQKAFVEEMENWLSTKPAEWGNEVSRELYGINLFKEKVYWPIKSASEYLQSRSGDSDNVKIKNSGFTRSTVEKANNPIYIGGFVDTWSQHVYEMATYHGFTLPLEDFTRIFNYATSASDIENGANSVKAMLTNAFGSEAPVQQIELLLKDVNGSARSDPTTELMNKGLAFMKKYAVAGSLSVAIQQPSAIARATAYIDPKYFAGEKITAEKHKELWEHMKKYAPVAAIKEIGYFDQGLGRSAREWMTAREYDGLAEKAKGLVTDSNYRSDVIMALPGLMDELTWCSIWQAVEREVADTTNLKTGSEEFNKRVGDRFTQIITETQVYDSVFSRSAMMRSKDVGVKMATAFMAEPLTNVSMVVDAIDDFRNGRTALGARKLGSVVASMLLNSILVSFVYAARNDDDDKSYIEKYIAALTGELKDGFNPLTYIPYIKDVVSIVQGYDVERNDMTMIADLWNAYTSLKSDKKSTYRKIEDFAGRIAQIFGLPLKNVMRDMRAAYYTYDTIANGEETTWKGALQAIAEGWTGESPSNSEQLYDALVSGNAKQADRVKARFEDESAAQAAVKKVIREKFAPTDGGKQSIDKQTAIKQLQDYAGMSKQEAEKQVAKWTVSLAYGFEYGDTKDEYLNGNITIDKAKRVLMGAGATDMEADAKTLQWKFEKDTGIAYDDMSDAYVSGDISRSDAVNYLVKYGKTYRTDAEATVQQWQCEKDTGFKYSELKDLYVAGTISADRAAALRSKYGGTSEDDAKSTVLQWQCVKDTGIEYSDIRKAYEEKRVSGEAVENMLMKYGGKSEDDAAARREKYDFTIANPGTEDISDAAVQKYNESVAAAGISGKDYYTSWQMYNRTESDYDENGKPISYSKLYKIAAYIDSLNLTNAQKDAMFCAFYTARNLRRTPWH